MNEKNTLLMLYGMGQPQYAARGLTQTLTPIKAALRLERSINGAAMDMSHEQFHKYETEITCTDVETPSLDGIWPGKIITIDCTCELSYVTDSGAAEREVVPDSEREQGELTFYRPRLDVMIVDFDVPFDEYFASYKWKMKAEEV